MLSGLYAYVATGLVAAAVGFTGGWKTQGWRWAATDRQRIELEAKERQQQLDRSHTASITFEDKRAFNEIRYRTATVTIEKVVDRPVYLQSCMDDDGLRSLNQQITRAADSGEPGIRMPKP